MSESKFTKKICDEAREYGAYIFVAAGNKYGTRGWPDRCFAHDGHVFWIEFKDANTILEPLQKATIERINLSAPNSAWVVRAPNTMEYFFAGVKAIDYFRDTIDLLTKIIEHRERYLCSVHAARKQ